MRGVYWPEERFLKLHSAGRWAYPMTYFGVLLVLAFFSYKQDSKRAKPVQACCKNSVRYFGARAMALDLSAAWAVSSSWGGGVVLAATGIPTS